MRIYLKRRGKRVYLYGQESYRVPGRKSPKTRSWYIGPAEDAQEREDRALAVAERRASKIDEWQRKELGETAQERRDREAEEARFNPAKFLEETRSVSKSGSEPGRAQEKSPALSGASEANDVAGEPGVGQT